MTYTIALDFPADLTIGELSDSLTKHNLTITQYIPHGPGGGNPEIYLSTDLLENIKNFLFNDYTFGDSDDTDYYLGTVIVK